MPEPAIPCPRCGDDLVTRAQRRGLWPWRRTFWDWYCERCQQTFDPLLLARAAFRRLNS